MSRWNRLLFGAMAVLVPALAGCEAGLDAPTLQFHPASVGANVIQNGITIDNVFVLGAPLGSALPAGGQAGVFLAIEAAKSDQLVSVSAQGIASSVTLDCGSCNLPAQKLVNLGGPTPTVVLNGLSGPLSGGQTVTLTFTFKQAGEIKLEVPVQPAAYDSATYSPPPTPTATAASTTKRKKKHPLIAASPAPSASPATTP